MNVEWVKFEYAAYIIWLRENNEERAVRTSYVTSFLPVLRYSFKNKIWSNFFGYNGYTLNYFSVWIKL